VGALAEVGLDHGRGPEARCDVEDQAEVDAVAVDERHLLEDVASCFGASSVIEADLGERTHRNRPLDELRPQAVAVLEVALQRAGVLGRSVPECPPLRTVPGYVRRTA
jgi:hypothetical protein